MVGLVNYVHDLMSPAVRLGMPPGDYKTAFHILTVLFFAFSFGGDILRHIYLKTSASSANYTALRMHSLQPFYDAARLSDISFLS